MTPISKNILLISGSGRKVGKTSFIRKVIEQNADQKLAVIKITPHFHEPTKGLNPIKINGDYRIFQETKIDSGKDSSLFLKAGADLVFYIQTTDEFLNEAFQELSEYILNNTGIVVESAALRKFIVPGLYLFIHQKHREIKLTAMEMKSLADVIVISDEKQFSVNPETVIYNQTWKIIPNDKP